MDETLDMKPEDRIEYWKLVMSDFKDSGLTRSEYCKQNEIKISTFDYWKRRLTDLDAYSKEGNGSRFAELRFSNGGIPVCDFSNQPDINTSGSFVTEMIILCGDVSFYINRSTPVDLISKILKEISRAK